MLNVSYKVLSSVLYNRLLPYAEANLGDYQCGFRVNHSTTDHLFTIRQIHEKAYEYNINLHNLYIDFKQALDSISREAMINDLAALGIPAKLIRLVKATLNGFKTIVRVNNEYTELFAINSSVRRCTISHNI